MNAEVEEALARLRGICLGLPEVTETDSWGHPNFRAGKRTFAAFEWIKGRPSIAIRLGSEGADAILLSRNTFFATPYGRGQWVSVWADTKPDWRLLRDLIGQGYRTVALKRMIRALDSRAGS
jgi:predicted DNA-binding protein (MmcQ/YjbR family)